ncbi:MAG: Rrf2 family transcriptional regulator [Alphaproteobacteria bacterium]
MHPQEQQTVKLNTRGQYAVMAMVELARAQNTRTLPLSEIADNAGISLSYLEQLIAGLRRHGLVASYRGPGGGYSLSKPAESIIVTEILVAAEDSTPARRSQTRHAKSKTCLKTHTLWEHAGHILSIALSKVTLQDVLNQELKNHPHTRKVFELMAKSA